MVSPVNTSVKHFRSDIHSSLVLNGTAGSLIGLLDACLVNGFGLQTASSLVVSSGVATLTFPVAFPANEDMVILVAGATGGWVDLNGEQRVTSIATATNTVRFNTAVADGTATGTITVKVAPAGWLKPFSGTNKAAYKSANPQAHSGGMFLRVDDNSALFARVVGYETMTDVDTGLNAFPTNIMQAGGGYWWRSTQSNTNATKWAIISDGRFLIFAPCPSSTTASSDSLLVMGFGDLVRHRNAGDAFAVWLNAGLTNSATTVVASLNTGTGGVSGRFVARSYTGLGTASEASCVPLVGSNNSSSGSDATLGSLPNEVSGKLFLSKKITTASPTNNAPRAEFPGILHVPHSNAIGLFGLFSKLDGTGDVTGRKLLFITSGSSTPANATATGGMFVDISGPWFQES